MNFELADSRSNNREFVRNVQGFHGTIGATCSGFCVTRNYEETRDHILLLLVSDGFVEVSIDDKTLRHMKN